MFVVMMKLNVHCNDEIKRSFMKLCSSSNDEIVCLFSSYSNEIMCLCNKVSLSVQF